MRKNLPSFAEYIDRGESYSHLARYISSIPLMLVVRGRYLPVKIISIEVAGERHQKQQCSGYIHQL